MRILSKFLVLTWKNFLLKRKHWLMTIFEILIPVVLFAILAILRFVETNISRESKKVIFSRGQFPSIKENSKKPTTDEAKSLIKYYQPSDYISNLNAMKGEHYRFCLSENTSVFYTAADEFVEDVDKIVNQMETFLDFACLTVSNSNKIGLYLLFIT